MSVAHVPGIRKSWADVSCKRYNLYINLIRASKKMYGLLVREDWMGRVIIELFLYCSEDVKDGQGSGCSAVGLEAMRVYACK